MTRSCHKTNIIIVIKFTPQPYKVDKSNTKIHKKILHTKHFILFKKKKKTVFSYVLAGTRQSIRCHFRITMGDTDGLERIVVATDCRLKNMFLYSTITHPYRMIQQTVACAT